MSRKRATCSIAFCGNQPPACSWARHSSGRMAECCRPGGYFVISRSAQARFSSVNAKLSGWIAGSARRRTAIREAQRSSIHLPEHDIKRTHDCRYIGKHVAARQKVHRLQMRKARGADLAFVRFIGAVGDQVTAEFAFGRLDGCVNLAGGHVGPLGIQLEMVEARSHE